MKTRSNNRLDLSTYTVADNAKAVRVADFRNAIERLESLVQVDFHACVSAAERTRWVEAAKRVGHELIGTTCKRADKATWERRESAIEASTDRIGSVLYG